MTPAQARRAIRIEDMTRSLRDDMRSQDGDGAACEHLSEAIRQIKASRAASTATIGNPHRLPVSVSLPTGLLNAVRQLAATHPDGQTGVIVEAIRASAAAPASTDIAEGTDRNDARTSVRIPADLMLLVDARAAAMGTTRSHAVRTALSAIVPD